jgi:fructoselysine transporter
LTAAAGAPPATIFTPGRAGLVCYAEWLVSTAGAELERGLGLKEATALNMIDMVGIGPFVVIPLVLQSVAGPQSLLAWVVGALLALLDGLVWSELGAAMPEAGGSYVFLREAYGVGHWGRLMSFLFVWQTIFQAPLVMASGSIGFAQYLSFLVPLGRYGQKAVAAGLIVVLIALLYRRIGAIGKISLLLWVGVFGTIGWLIFAGATHFDFRLAFGQAPAWNFSWLFFAGLGAATVDTVYCFWGYYNVCLLGAEVKQPEKNIPRSILISILAVAALYLAMQTSVLGVVPWREVSRSQFVISTFFERIYGPHVAAVATVLILWIAFASLFSLTLGYSRIPYAAARDGNFFRVFGRVHPTKRFPHVSLLFLGAAGLAFSLLFSLRDVIRAITAMRVLIQFAGQGIGVILLRRRWPAGRLPFKMRLFPVPALIAVTGWLALFVATGWFALAGIVAIAAGAIAFLLRSRALREWPYAEVTE